MKKIYSLICFLFFTFSVNATHLAYMDLTYKCLGGNTYEFTLTLYRDCSTLAAPNSMAVNACSPSSGASTVISLDTIAGTGLPVFPVCSFPLSDCVGGTDEGFQKYVYRKVHTLPSAKPDWTFSVQICCREVFITNISSPIVTGEAILCVLDNFNFPGNSSPTFNDEPVLFACCNQSFSYNQSATDIDGDSLVYSLYHPLDNIPSCTGRDSVNYVSGFTYLQPITSSPAISM